MTFDYAATKKRGWLAYDACLPHALNIPLLNRVRVYVSIVSIDMVGRPVDDINLRMGGKIIRNYAQRVSIIDIIGI